MEDGRFWPPILVLLLVVGSLFAFRYMEQVDVANGALVDAKLALEQTKESLAGRREMWKAVEAASLKLSRAQQKTKEAATIQNEADKKERLVEGDLKYTIKSFKEAVEKVRADAVGTDIPELVLLNGKTLKGAKIRKAESASISFLHAEGISSASVNDLPRDLVDKFDMGTSSITVQLEQLESNISNNVASTPAASESPELLALRKRIAQLTIQIDSASTHKDKLETEVKNYNDQIKAAELVNNPTFNLRTMRDVAEGNAGLARNELKLLKAELEKRKTEEAAFLPR